MTTKKRGRKPIPTSEKVKLCSVYLRDEDKKAIIKQYGSITKAIKSQILKPSENETTS